MYRQTDNRKVWYEWMVEVFKLVTELHSSPGGIQAQVQTPLSAGGSNSNNSNQKKGVVPVVPLTKEQAATMSGAILANGTSLKSASRRSQAQGQQVRRLRVGLSEMHSSIKDGCLM